MISLAPVYSQLADVLRERLSVISDRGLYAHAPQEHLLQLQSASERIVALQRQLPSPVDSQFTHYLQRCSYDKALAWLEENGCVKQNV